MAIQSKEGFGLFERTYRRNCDQSKLTCKISHWSKFLSRIMLAILLCIFLYYFFKVNPSKI